MSHIFQPLQALWFNVLLDVPVGYQYKKQRQNFLELVPLKPTEALFSSLFLSVLPNISVDDLHNQKTHTTKFTALSFQPESRAEMYDNKFYMK